MPVSCARRLHPSPAASALRFRVARASAGAKSAAGLQISAGRGNSRFPARRVDKISRLTLVKRLVAGASTFCAPGYATLSCRKPRNLSQPAMRVKRKMQEQNLSRLASGGKFWS